MELHQLEGRIGYAFKNPELLELALTHPSYALQLKGEDNQRLEFLGDAVLQICVSQRLFEKYERLREGQLTRKRAALVCEANLAQKAEEFGLGEFLRLNHGEDMLGGRENPSILGDAMEAVIAAVWLDGGVEAAQALVDRMMGTYETKTRAERDPKSALQEYLQGHGEEAPTYVIVREDGPPHARVFTSHAIRGNGTVIGEGMGDRKQRAEEAAARVALASLRKAAKKKDGEGTQTCV